MQPASWRTISSRTGIRERLQHGQHVDGVEVDCFDRLDAFHGCLDLRHSATTYASLFDNRSNKLCTVRDRTIAQRSPIRVIRTTASVAVRSHRQTDQARLGHAARALRCALPRRPRRLDDGRRASVDPADLDMSTSSLQWVVSAYVLGYGGFLLLGGRAADLLGRRRVFLIALGVFVVASMLGGLADDGTFLIVTRFIKGVSAAFTAPGRAVDHHDDVRRGPRAQQGALDLHRHRRDRVLARARDRRAADGDRLALGLLPPRARRARHADRRAPARARRDRRGLRTSRAFDVFGAVSMTAGDAAARLHARRGAGRRLGLGPDARLVRRRRRDPGRVRGARARTPRAARPARHPALGLARAREPRRRCRCSAAGSGSSSSPRCTCRSCSAGRRSRPGSRSSPAGCSWRSSRRGSRR